MVGWNRRNREARERDDRHWNSLTHEQKMNVLRDAREFDAKVSRILLWLVLTITLLAFFVYCAVEAYRWVIR